MLLFSASKIRSSPLGETSTEYGSIPSLLPSNTVSTVYPLSNFIIERLETAEKIEQKTQLRNYRQLNFPKQKMEECKAGKEDPYQFWRWISSTTTSSQEKKPHSKEPLEQFLLKKWKCRKQSESQTAFKGGKIAKIIRLKTWVLLILIPFLHHHHHYPIHLLAGGVAEAEETPPKRRRKTRAKVSEILAIVENEED